MAVHVIGNACIDMTFRADRLPAPGESVCADRSEKGLGGKGLNQAVAARRAGSEVCLWAAIGSDDGADEIVARLAAEGIPAGDLLRLSRRTDQSTIIVDGAGENMIVSDVSCARIFDPFADAAAASKIGAGDFVVLQGNLRPAVTRDTIVRARSRRATIVYNASPLDGSEATLPGAVDVLVVNRLEAHALSGAETPADAAAILMDKGAKAVVVTLGAEGALIRDAEGSRLLAGYAAVAVDTSGAGDVFCGVLVAGLDGGFGLADAAAWANRAAALATTRMGALSACPTPSELVEILRPRERGWSSHHG
jgi:ribokinase